MKSLLKKYVLTSLYEKNDEETQILIETTINKKPSLTDEVGFVYGYTKEADANTKLNFQIKLGRTKHANPNDRIKQWGGDIKFCQQTIYNKRLERLVHLFFRFANVHRVSSNGDNEIEWFHFTEKINVSKYVSILAELVEDLYGCDDDDDDDDVVEIKKPVVVKSEIKQVKLNINTSSIAQLMTLDNIGMALATNIVAYREKNGEFDDVVDLKKCKGIGIARFNKIQNSVCV